MPVWLMIASVALLTATLTLATDRVLLPRLAPSPTPTPSPTPVATPRPREIVVVITPEPEPTPLPVTGEEHDLLLRRLLQESSLQRSGILVLKAERHVALAMESLLNNDPAQTDKELVAATVALDDALRVAPEDLKPQITSERWMIGRVRADLEINPRDLDHELRRMRDRLLALVGTPARD